MRSNGTIVFLLLALLLPVHLHSQTAGITTVSGSVVQGEVQGLIVAKVASESSAMAGFYRVELAVFRGQDIRSIQDSGIVAVAWNRWTSNVSDPDHPPMPDAVVASLIAADTSKAWSQPVGAVRLKILGELSVPKDGTAAQIVPSVRIRVQGKEVSIPVAQLPDATLTK